MFYGAQFHQVIVDGDTMNYMEFGKGTKPLIILPGLGDGLSPVHGQMQAIAFAISYKQFAHKFKVYMFSRKNHLEAGYSTKDMAKDQAKAMKALEITNANVMGVSQGGMIAQYLAVEFPDLVDKLVLAVTIAKQNELIQEVAGNWMRMAEQRNYRRLIIDTVEKSYSVNYLKKYRLLYPLLGSIGKPKEFGRFLIQASACMEHNAYPQLDKINCPTLVIGGDSDRIVGANSSLELAEKIKNSDLYVYQGLGHATYEEAKDFNHRVLNFLME